MARVYVAVGSNVDKESNIPSALRALRKVFDPLYVSSVYETKAVGFEGDDFHNLVVGFDSRRSPSEINRTLRRIEAEHGRTRGKEQFESRTLDLDQLLHGDLVMQADGVSLPHPDILRYNFVLRPLAELAGDIVHPEEKQPLAKLWEESTEKEGMKVVAYESGPGFGAT